MGGLVAARTTVMIRLPRAQATRLDLEETVGLLLRAGARIAVFGGWAEELRALRAPGPHSDIDLLCEGFEPIDALLREDDSLIEIDLKRFAHKRAFEFRGARVELFLVEPTPSGWSTTFWGSAYRWPDDVWGDAVQEMPVASPAALMSFRRDHDEIVRPRIAPYDWGWPADFVRLATPLRAALPHATVEHIGSTSIPGMPAKDVIDIQISVAALDASRLAGALEPLGYRLRPDDARDHVPPGWSGDVAAWDKLVFAPAADARPANVHVRIAGAANARYARLFRDYLRADAAVRDAWGGFKLALAQRVDFAAYGQIKDAAADALMPGAEAWAARTVWSVEDRPEVEKGTERGPAK